MANSDMLIRVQADTKNYNANLAQASRTLSSFAKNNLTASGAVKQMTTAMTGMAAQFVGAYAAINAAKKVMSDMININKQFEQGTANLASIIGKSTSEITALTTQAKNLGATTRYTAMQITELQTNLARLGFTQQEILNSTTAVQALATATGADLGEAANLAGAALRGFGMNASEMERVASVLSVSTTKSALSFEKLATAVPIVAPVAKQFGFTIEDTVTLLAKLSDAGMDASSAATATRNIFLKMANDSGKLATALGRPVHSVEEFGEALADMRKKGMSLNDILQMVGVRSTAAFAVFADNAETLKDFKQSITDCGDAMHDMENKQLNTLQGSLTILNSAWEGLMLSFSESTGPIKTAVDALTELLGTWTKWRNRNAGGDAAIQSYELGVSDEQKRNATSQINRQRSQGVTDDEIAKASQSRKALYEKERDAMTELLAKWEKAGKLGWGSKAVQDLMGDVEEQFGKMEGAPYKWAEEMYKRIAGTRDRIALEDFIISSVTPAPSTTSTSGEGSDDSGKGQVAKLRAQYEAEEKEQIAHLDRMNMSEADYEAKVYDIKRTALERIAKLYDEDSKEYAQVMAKKYDLDIRYQAKQMQLASKAERETERQRREEERKREQELRQQQQLDNSILGGLTGVAKSVGWTSADLGTTGIKTRINAGVDITEDEWKKFEEKLNERLKELHMDPIEINFETGAIEKPFQAAKKDMSALVDGVQGAISAFGQLGSAMQSLEDPSAKVAGIIMGAIASVAAGLGQAIASHGGRMENGGPWAWIGFAISATATMISTIAAIKSATSAGNFANGGVIGGNSYSGDNLIAHVNSGETILSAAQSDVIASKLTAGNGGGGGMSQPYLTGDVIILGMNNYLGRSGQGEIVTTSMLRRAGIRI